MTELREGSSILEDQLRLMDEKVTLRFPPSITEELSSSADKARAGIVKFRSSHVCLLHGETHDGTRSGQAPATLKHLATVRVDSLLKLTNSPLSAVTLLDPYLVLPQPHDCLRGKSSETSIKSLEKLYPRQECRELYQQSFSSISIRSRAEPRSNLAQSPFADCDRSTWSSGRSSIGPDRRRARTFAARVLKHPPCALSGHCSAGRVKAAKSPSSTPSGWTRSPCTRHAPRPHLEKPSSTGSICRPAGSTWAKDLVPSVVLRATVLAAAGSRGRIVCSRCGSSSSTSSPGWEGNQREPGMSIGCRGLLRDREGVRGSTLRDVVDLGVEGLKMGEEWGREEQDLGGGAKVSV